MKEQTYNVIIKTISVTATSKEEALKYAVDDIVELHKEGSLEVEIEEIGIN